MRERPDLHGPALIAVAMLQQKHWTGIPKTESEMLERTMEVAVLAHSLVLAFEKADLAVDRMMIQSLQDRLKKGPQAPRSEDQFPESPHPAPPPSA